MANNDIEDVRKAEERRGKRPLDSTAIAETRRRRAALRELLQYSTPGEFEELMREAGIEPRSEDWRQLRRTWEQMKKPRGSR